MSWLGSNLKLLQVSNRLEAVRCLWWNIFRRQSSYRITKESLAITNFQDRVLITGLMGSAIMVCGSRARWRVMGSSIGLMAPIIGVSTGTTFAMGKERWSFPLIRDFEAISHWDSSTAMGSWSLSYKNCVNLTSRQKI